MAVSHGVKVAVASDFLNSFSRIPRRQQAKVLDFVTRFRADPTSTGIHYEKIANAADANMRSVRIGDDYRGIVLKPEAGNVYLLLWVDHHDRAYQWAERKRYRIHPETGSIQLIEVEEGAPEPAEKAEGGQEDAGLFAGIRDRQLLRLGVPEEKLNWIRTLSSQEELDRAMDDLPQEAYEALFFLADGYSFEEVCQEFGRTDQDQAVDTADFGSALEHPDSRRRFVVVEDDLVLAAILNAPLEKWRIFLHPSQQKLVERHWNGPVRVLGGAGTGKTVAAMHRARWLAESIFQGDNDRILFTTFTRNLATDIEENLSRICAREAMRRIEVINLDRWVARLLKKKGYRYQIDYGDRTRDLWHRAVDLAPAEPDLPLSFYREEWERVVQPQEIDTVEQYMKASRLGRGARLNRKSRREVWKVFEEYRALLNEHGLREREDALEDARHVLESASDFFPYRAVVVDEAQDMGPQAFRLIRRMVPEEQAENSLFIVGDAHQRIYRHKVVLGQCGIDIRGRSRKLRINYRTTDETRKWAVGLLEGVTVDDLDGGVDDQKGYKSLTHGAAPEIRRFGSFREEAGFIAAHLQESESKGEALKESCLVVRTNDLLSQYESALSEKGIETYRIRRSQPEDRAAPGLRLATMHRVKGLEFDWVIIAGVNEGVVPFAGIGADSADPVVQRETEIQERALLYVASTRAKKEVLVTSFGEPSRFLSE